MKDKRFLRSPILRNILYESANGLCQICGVTLEKDWHADHIEPWSVSRRTNIFDMQALCPSCNLKKGDKVPGDYRFSYDSSKLRPGQRGAIDTIRRRIMDGETHTAIVLPTRYGKTDVMRLAGLSLQSDGLVSHSVIVTPNAVLRDQAVRGDKMDESMVRYKIPRIPGGFSTFKVEESPRRPFPPQKASIISMTTQMLNLNWEFFTHWIKYLKMPPVVFVDEAHTGSDLNEWGRSVDALAESGAFVVLLTATPYRSDGRPIPGFDVTREPVEPVRIFRPRAGNEFVDIYERERYRYRLEAHHITSFRDAWDTEDPPPLCYVERRPFDVDLERIDSLTAEIKGQGKLSSLSIPNTRTTLGRVLREAPIIRQACAELVNVLSTRKKDWQQTAAIVFVGNDKVGDFRDNEHAERVRDALSVLDQGLDVMIATSSDTKDAAKTIDRFISGQGDVLIVKQMAGIGLDVDRLKVCLDLSSVRTPAAFVQRLTRICTVWQPTNNPYDTVRTSTYITPDDCFGAALFQKFITDEGGERTTTDAESDQFIGSREAFEQQALPPPDFYIPTGTSLPETIEDSQKRTAPGEALPEVDKLFGLIPELSRTRTQPEMANIMESAGLGFHNGNEQVEYAEVRDINAERKDIQHACNDLVRQVAYKRTGGASGEAIKQVWADHKRRVAYEPWVKLRDIDSDILERMRRNLEQELRSST